MNGGWQPIESAPRCEMVMLAWDGFSVFEAYWYGGRAVTNQSLSPRPWVTHWMPLPPPPSDDLPVATNSGVGERSDRLSHRHEIAPHKAVS